METEKRGGKRPGAGRKPITDKKIPVTTYPRQSQIEILGGIDQAKELILNVIEEKVKTRKKYLKKV